MGIELSVIWFVIIVFATLMYICLLYTSPSPRDTR